MTITDECKKVGKLGLSIAGAPSDRKCDDTVDFGIGLSHDIHAKQATSAPNSKPGSRRGSVDEPCYPRPVHVNLGPVGVALDADVKVQKELTNSGLNAFI